MWGMGTNPLEMPGMVNNQPLRDYMLEKIHDKKIKRDFIFGSAEIYEKKYYRFT